MTHPDTSIGTRKRNNRCHNKICACTGECFVDDGTGDFAKSTDPRIGLERLRSRMLGWEDCDNEIKQLLKAARAYRRLGVVYRTGKRPTEVLFKMLEEADKVMDSYEDVTV